MTVYIQNKVLHMALGKVTLKEVFSGKKLGVNHFRIFGSITYCHVPDEKCTKLDETTRGYLVGYSETSKAYRIYVPSSRKIIVRRDVKFMEDRAFKKSWEMPTGDQSEPT